MNFYKEPWFIVLVLFIIIYLIVLAVRNAKGGIDVTNIDYTKRTFDATFKWGDQKESVTKESWYDSSVDILSGDKDKYDFIVENTKEGSIDTKQDSTYLKIMQGNKIIYGKKISWKSKKIGTLTFWNKSYEE